MTIDHRLFIAAALVLLGILLARALSTPLPPAAARPVSDASETATPLHSVGGKRSVA